MPVPPPPSSPAAAPVPAGGPATPAVDLTRQRLIRTALELFTTRGYHDTTTALIAKKAGIAEGTIYRHFASKQQLMNELYRAAQRWAVKLAHDAGTAALASPAGAPETARIRLASLAQGLLDGAARDPAVVKLGLLDRYDALLDEDSRKSARELRLAIERIVAEGKAAGAVRPGMVDVWAALWLAAVTLAVDKVARGEWKPSDAAARLVIDGAWTAIAIPASPRAPGA
ncbi:MAG: TetR/AcrR family transcriptional regulator [Gemmatimonadales bacterium]